MSDDIGSKDVGGGAIAQALAWRCVQSCTEPAEIVLVEGLRIGVAAEPPPEPLVRVLDAALVPGRLRIAKPGPRPEFSLEVRPIGELRSAIECDRSAGAERQGAQHLGDLSHDWLRALLGGRRTTTNRLSRSTLVVTLAGPNFWRKWRRSASKWPNSLRPATASGRNRMLSSGANFGGGRLRRRYPRRLRRPEARWRQSSAARPSSE